MNRVTFQLSLEMDYGITFNGKLKLSGSNIFFRKILMKIKKKINENDFIKLTKERYSNYENFKHKEILGESNKCVLYRIAGKLYLNLKNNNEWKTARIY